MELGLTASLICPRADTFGFRWTMVSFAPCRSLTSAATAIYSAGALIPATSMSAAMIKSGVANETKAFMAAAPPAALKRIS